MFASIAQTSFSNSWTDGGTSFLGVDVEDDSQFVHGDVEEVEEEDQLVHGDVDLDGPTGLCYSLLLPLHQRVPPPQAVVVDPLFFKKSLVEPP